MNYNRLIESDNHDHYQWTKHDDCDNHNLTHNSHHYCYAEPVHAQAHCHDHYPPPPSKTGLDTSFGRANISPPKFVPRMGFFFFFFINTRPKSKSPRPNSGRVSPSYRSDPIPLGQGQACGTRTGKRKMGTSRFLRNRIHGWRHASKRPFSGPRGTKNHAGVPGMWATA